MQLNVCDPKKAKNYTMILVTKLHVLQSAITRDVSQQREIVSSEINQQYSREKFLTSYT